MSVPIALAIVAASPATAHAAWTFYWACMGNCETDSGSDSGNPVYGTPEECKAAYDERRAWGNAPGRNMNFLSCSEIGGTSTDGTASDDPTPAEPAGPPAKALPLSRFEVGYGVGDGWSHRNDGGDFERGEPTRGLALGLHVGHQYFAGYAEVEWQSSAIDNPHFGAGRHTLRVVPLWFGFSSTVVPIVKRHAFELRPDATMALGFAASATCTDCAGTVEVPDTTGIGFRFRLGLDAYFGPGRIVGLGADLNITALALGDVTDPFLPDPIELDAPILMFRFGLTLRLGG